MTDIKLNAAGDIDLSSGGAELVTGLDASAQRLKIAMQSFQGDWFLDLADGLPYFGRILIKNLNEGDVQSLYFRQALRQPDVVSVDEISLTFLPTSTFRRLDVDMKVTFIQSPESVAISTTTTVPV